MLQSTTFKNISLENNEGFAVMTICREAKLNALNTETLEEIREAVKQVYDDSTINSLVITGQGEKAFAAGADISEFTELSKESAKRFSESGQRIFDLIENCPKPIIAAVNGFALGGGCELAMACHMRVATAVSRFGQPEVSLGIVPGYGGTQRMTRLIGKAKALELMMTGEMISAAAAMKLGLINHIVETLPELLPLCRKILGKIAQQGPIAVAKVIACVNNFEQGTDGYAKEAEEFAECCMTEDFKEGTAAFMEKRSPNFAGK